LKRPILVLLYVFAGLGCLASSVPAQQRPSPASERVSFVRAGFLFGRTGTSVGSSVYLEMNPVRWLGFCAFAGQSRAISRQVEGLVHAWDSSTGACIITHVPQWKGFLLSPFAQFLHQRDHQHIDFPQPDGTTYSETISQTHRLWGLGLSVDRAIVKDGPRLAVRIGRDFGGGPAVKDGAGVYAVGGVIFPLDHPVALGRSFRRMATPKQ
jgi:hypothetical protein